MEPRALIYPSQLMEEYQRLEAQLSAGHPIEDPQIRADHAAIKARVDAGQSLLGAICKHFATKLDELAVQMRTQGMN